MYSALAYSCGYVESGRFPQFFVAHGEYETKAELLQAFAVSFYEFFEAYFEDHARKTREDFEDFVVSLPSKTCDDIGLAIDYTMMGSWEIWPSIEDIFSVPLESWVSIEAYAETILWWALPEDLRLTLPDKWDMGTKKERFIECYPELRDLLIEN